MSLRKRLLYFFIIAFDWFGHGPNVFSEVCYNLVFIIHRTNKSIFSGLTLIDDKILSPLKYWNTCIQVWSCVMREQNVVCATRGSISKTISRRVCSCFRKWGGSCFVLVFCFLIYMGYLHSDFIIVIDNKRVIEIITCTEYNAYTETDTLFKHYHKTTWNWMFKICISNTLTTNACISFCKRLS